MRSEGEPTESGESTARPSAASLALDALLCVNAGTLVAAFGLEGTFVPVPDSVPLHGRAVFEGRSGIDLIVPADQPHVIEGWAQAAEEPVVRIDVRLLADPDQPSAVHFFDVRADHGVHVIVLESRDPQEVITWAEVRAEARRVAAHVKRDGVGVFLEVDRATTALLGWDPTDLVGRRTLELVHPDDVEGAIDGWMAMRAGSGQGRTQIRYRHADGHYVWLEVTNDNRLDDPEVGAVLSELVDISEQMAHLEALHTRERLLARLAEALPIGICHVRSDRQVLYSNEPMIELVGVIDTVDSLVRSVAGADREPVATALDKALQGRPGNLEVSVIRGFEEIRCELTFRAMTSDDGSVDGVIVCAADVTDRSRLRSELEHRASHDALSGCLNRIATVTALERALRAGQQVAVAYIDLDHFKGINDELGHAAGDELLRVAAARMRSVTRVEDRIGRMGGDEFVVICPRGQGPFEAAELVDRLTEAISGDVVFGKQRVHLRASVGATISVDGEVDPDAVFVRADAAMYEAKRRARSQRTEQVVSTPGA